MALPALEAELRFFAQHKQEWLPSDSGNFVVIAGTTVAGFYPNYQAAFRQGWKNSGILGDFLVKQVCKEEPVHFIY